MQGYNIQRKFKRINTNTRAAAFATVIIVVLLLCDYGVKIINHVN
ncbi:MAG: hypothetical protein WCP79_11915 [Bacillota bacterium]